MEASSISDIRCNPSYKSSYVLHDFHDFVSKDVFDAGMNKGPKNAGLTLTVHYVKGIIPNTHLRVA